MTCPQLKTHEVHALVLLVTGSERMAKNIAADYTETLGQFGAEGVTVDGDRWLVLTLISYGYDVDRMSPRTVVSFTDFNASKRKPIRASKEQIRAALLEVNFADRFCFLLRYSLGWDLDRIARLMLCNGPRVELAIGTALAIMRSRIIQKESQSATLAQPEAC